MAVAARPEQSYDSVAMPDSLLKRAYRATSFLSISKAIAAIGLSALTLLWNWRFGMRNWDTTKTFLLCVLLGYGSLAVIALAWNLSVLGARDWWASFVGGMKTDILGAIKDAATQAAPAGNQPSALIEPWHLKRLHEFLSDKPKGSVRVMGKEGDPVAYSLSQRLADAFRQSGWNATQTSLNAHFSGGSVFVIDHALAHEVSKDSPLIREALLASGIAFRRWQLSDAAYTTCTIFIETQES